MSTWAILVTIPSVRNVNLAIRMMVHSSTPVSHSFHQSGLQAVYAEAFWHNDMDMSV